MIEFRIIFSFSK